MGCPAPELGKGGTLGGSPTCTGEEGGYMAPTLPAPCGAAGGVEVVNEFTGGGTIPGGKGLITGADGCWVGAYPPPY